MKLERGKAVETFSNSFSEFNFSAASEMPCKKHPNSSSVGICAHCLKDRLVKLVCSDCGEQRLSSCSCSCSDDVSSSYRNSCSTMDVGSVGRVSFLIENDKIDPVPQSKSKRGGEKSEQVIFLRRSSSSCVEVKKSNGFWRIKRLFRKYKKSERNGEFGDDKSEIWVRDVMGVSRCRSLCSFRGGNNNDADESARISECAFSSAKISDVTSGIFVDSEKNWGFSSESSDQPRKSGFRIGQSLIEIDGVKSVPNRSVFPAKESDFRAMDESAFIDLKLDLLSSESKEVCGAARSRSSNGGGSDHKSESFENGVSLASLKSNGGSCRISVNERGLKRGSRSHKVWKWIFKYHSLNKKGENNILKS